MKNNLENKEILSDEILAAIDLIIERIPHVVFGGSIALNAIGLLNRKISDIDIFFGLGENLWENEFLRLSKNADLHSITVTDINGEKIQRTGAIILGVKTCCFKVPTEMLQCSKFEFNNRTINIQNVNHAIIAKMTYADKSIKHKEDLKQIDMNFDRFF